METSDTGNNEFVWLGNITDMDGIAFLILTRKSNGTKIMDVFTKFIQCQFLE